MKTVKQTVIIYIDVPPIDHEAQQVVPSVTTYGGCEPMRGAIRKTLALTLDVPVRYEELPADSVVEISPSANSAPSAFNPA